MGRCLAIIQARMGSTRLPGKAMREVFGKPLIGHMIDRVERAEFIDQLVVATTTKSGDDPLAHYCEGRGVSVYRGSEEDVLDRFHEAARDFGGEVVVRLTADCPLIDPSLIDSVVDQFVGSEFDYLSNTQDRAFPRGMDVEVFTVQALERAHQEAIDPHEREHVTLHIYRNPETFAIGQYEYRLTVDTPEDFKVVSLLLEAASKKGIEKLSGIIGLLEENPEWVTLNAHIPQRRI